eukprot:g5290.t1
MAPISIKLLGIAGLLAAGNSVSAQPTTPSPSPGGGGGGRGGGDGGGGGPAVPSAAPTSAALTDAPFGGGGGGRGPGPDGHHSHAPTGAPTAIVQDTGAPTMAMVEPTPSPSMGGDMDVTAAPTIPDGADSMDNDDDVDGGVTGDEANAADRIFTARSLAYAGALGLAIAASSMLV